MQTKNIGEGQKINILSIDVDNITDKKIYTEILLCNHSKCLYVIYEGVYITGEKILTCNQVTDIESIFCNEEGEISMPYEIINNMTIKGSYSNGLKFNFPSARIIGHSFMTEEEIIICKEVEKIRI